MPSEKSGKDRITKADRTKARLIEVATRLFQEHGSDEVTVRRIAAPPRSKPAASTIISARATNSIRRARARRRQRPRRGFGAVAEAGADSSPLVRLRAALGAHLKYTLRHHFSSRLKSIRRLPKRLREQHMQERDYAAIFAGLLAEAGRKVLHSGFDPQWCVCSPWAP